MKQGLLVRDLGKGEFSGRGVFAKVAVDRPDSA